jgi:hypothetical protein
MMSHPLGNVFEAMMEKRQDQIQSTSILADPNPYPNPNLYLNPNLNPNLNPSPNLNPKPNPNLNPYPTLALTLNLNVHSSNRCPRRHYLKSRSNFRIFSNRHPFQTLISIGPFIRSKFAIKNNCNDSFVF